MKIQKEIWIGFIAVLSVALLTWGMNYLKGKNILKSSKLYYGVYDKIEGLQPTSPVLIKGYKVGHVEDIHFDDPDHPKNLTVVLSIHGKFKIPRQSRAIIFSSDLMGTKAVKIELSDKGTFYQEGDTLVTAVEADLKEQVSIQMLPLKNKAEDLMKELQEAIEIVRYIFNEKTRENISKSLESVKTTIANLESTSFTLDTLMEREQKRLDQIFFNISSISSNLKNNNQNLTNALENISNISDSIAQADLATTLHQTNRLMTETSDIMAKINRGEGTMGLLIHNDTLYQNLEKTTGQLEKLVKDIQNNPRKYLRFSLININKTGKNKENKKKDTKGAR